MWFHNLTIKKNTYKESIVHGSEKYTPEMKCEFFKSSASWSFIPWIYSFPQDLYYCPAPLLPPRFSVIYRLKIRVLFVFNFKTPYSTRALIY